VVIAFIVVLSIVVVGLAFWIRHLRAQIRQMAMDHRKQVLSLLRDAERIELAYRRELKEAKETERWSAQAAAYKGGFKDGLGAAKKAVRQAAAQAATTAIDELLKK
jgi:predicted Holliday junction resolvase-like endonuclease